MKIDVFLLFLFIFLVLSQPISAKDKTYVNASELGLVAYNKSEAKNNSNKIVSAINMGIAIRIDKTYYVGKADKPIKNNIILEGQGSLVMTNSLCFTVNAPISVYVEGICIRTLVDVNALSQVRFIENSGVNYHDKISFTKCTIDGVRVFSHIAADVDQTLTLDGVREFIFTDNMVSRIGYYAIRLNNCKSDIVRIENNIIRQCYSVVFGLGLNNSYRPLPFARISKLFFRGNDIDNDGYVVDDEYSLTYYSPIIAEVGYCECVENTIKNFICIGKKSVAVYPFYISGDTVLIQRNEIKDCINLGNSANNQFFKCKQVLTGDGVRVIRENTCSITEDCIMKYAAIGTEVEIKIMGLQAKEMKRVEVEKNQIDVACGLSFGAETACKYHSLLFADNVIKCAHIGTIAKSLAKLSACIDGLIVVKWNKVVATEPINKTYGLFDGNVTGYSIRVTDNTFIGSIPYGGSSPLIGKPKSFISIGNLIDMGTINAPVYMCNYATAIDTYEGGGREGYAVRIVPIDCSCGKFVLRFAGGAPKSISFFHGLLSSANCVATVIAGTRRTEYKIVVGDRSVKFVCDNRPNEVMKYDRSQKVRMHNEMGLGDLISDGINLKFVRSEDIINGYSIVLDYK